MLINYYSQPNILIYLHRNIFGAQILYLAERNPQHAIDSNLLYWFLLNNSLRPLSFPLCLWVNIANFCSMYFAINKEMCFWLFTEQSEKSQEVE